MAHSIREHDIIYSIIYHMHLSCLLAYVQETVRTSRQHSVNGNRPNAPVQCFRQHCGCKRSQCRGQKIDNAHQLRGSLWKITRTNTQERDELMESASSTRCAGLHMGRKNCCNIGPSSSMQDANMPQKEVNGPRAPWHSFNACKSQSTPSSPRENPLPALQQPAAETIPPGSPKRKVRALCRAVVRPLSYVHVCLTAGSKRHQPDEEWREDRYRPRCQCAWAEPLLLPPSYLSLQGNPVDRLHGQHAHIRTHLAVLLLL